MNRNDNADSEKEKLREKVLQMNRARQNAADAFDSIFREDAPFEDFCRIFDECEDPEKVFMSMLYCDRLVSRDFLAKCEKKHLFAIYNFLSNCRSDTSIRLASQVVWDRRIPDSVRTLFWHIAEERASPFCNSMKRVECGTDAESSFDQKTSFASGRYDSPRGIISPRLEDAIRHDSAALFEISRQLSGKQIRIALLEHLLKREAGECFAYLLRKNSQKIFKIKPPEEWLFLFCRAVSEKTALLLVEIMEKLLPGIVARVKDPWGNNLLWHARMSRNHWDQKTELMQKLVDLGCDADSRNHFGLSVSLGEANSYERYFQELIEGGNDE